MDVNHSHGVIGNGMMGYGCPHLLREDFKTIQKTSTAPTSTEKASSVAPKYKNLTMSNPVTRG